jgi:hypothetical protein
MNVLKFEENLKIDFFSKKKHHINYIFSYKIKICLKSNLLFKQKQKQ